MTYKVGDKVFMGWKRRTLWEWLTNKPKEPQEWVVLIACNELGGVSYIEPAN